MNPEPSQPVRVCYLIDRLATGGTELQLLRLIGGLNRSRVQPYLCLLDGQGGESRRLEPESCPVMRLGVTSLHHPATLARAFRFIRALRTWNIDVLQVHFPDSTYFGVPTGRIAGVRRIVRTRRDLFHWVTPVQKVFGRPIDYLYNRFFVDATVANCEACRQAAITSERSRPESVVVLENGIDLDAFRSVAPLAPVLESQRPVRIGVVAMLRPEKQLHVLVAAAKILIARGRHVEFAIAGEGDVRSSLEKMIGESELTSHVRFYDRVADVPAFLATLDLAVLCSNSEGLSNSIIEYMAAGRAIVATAVGGNRELIGDGVTGLLVPPGDPERLAEACQTLLDNPELRVQLARAAQVDVAARFALDAMIQRHEEFYIGLHCAPNPRGQSLQCG